MRTVQILVAQATLILGLSASHAIESIKWNWADPLPQGMAIGAMRFPDSLHGWAIGEGSVVMRSVDAGTTWSPVSIPINFEMYDLDFADADHGTIVGRLGTLVSTQDGGKNWSVTKIPGSPSIQVIAYGSECLGIATGVLSDSALRTRDCGVTWTKIHIPGGGRIFDDLVSIGSDDFILSGYQSLPFRTEDGGDTWRPATINGVQSSFFIGMLWLAFMDGKIGVGATLDERMRIWRTVDGGLDWSVVGGDQIGPVGKGGISMSRDGQGAIISRGNLYRTRDSGATWKVDSTAPHLDFHAACVHEGKILLSGPGGALIQSAGPDSAWNRLDRRANLGRIQSRLGIDIPDGIHGAAISGDGSIRFTRDGGTTWEDAILPEGAGAMSYLAFANHEVGIALGENLKMLRTVDRGRTWRTVTVENLTGRFTGIDFADMTIGIVTGTDFILRSLDGGASWNRIPGPPAPGGGTYPGADAIGFASPHNAVAIVGRVIFHSPDGGDAWTRRTSEDAGGLAICSPDSNTFLIPGFFNNQGRGHILRSTDGGRSWKMRYLEPVTAQVQDFAFFNPRDGFAVGNEVEVTHDGGETWEPVASPPKKSFWNVETLSGGRLFITGGSSAGGGNAWSFISDPIPSIPAAAIRPIRPWRPAHIPFRKSIDALGRPARSFPAVRILPLQ